MGAVAPVPPLRGRGPEIAVLGEALGQVASGRPAVVLIEGEAGIGKTRLLDAALADARGRGMQVTAGRAGELEQTRPFGLVADIFGCVRSSPDPRRAAIAGLLAAGGDGGYGGYGAQGPITVTSDPGLRFRAVDAFADLAEELALAGPLVIGADDLQWADPASLLTLAALSRRLAYLPAALIGCLRPSPHGPELDRLAAALTAAGARHLILRGLTADAVTELVAEAVAAMPGPGLLAGIAGAAGNPLFVTEMLAALVQEDAIQTSDGRAEAAAMAPPPSLRLTILRRISFLPEDTLQALRAASIMGSGFSLTDLATVTGRSALELSVALAEAIRARVLEDDGDRLRFRHDLIRDAIYEDLPLSVRHALHREAGHRLAQSGAPALLVAEHLTRGARPADAETIGWLTRAARETAPRSPDVAADLLERAIGLTDPADPGRDRLLAEQASSLMWAGRISAAKNICRALLERGHDPGVEGSARLCLGYALVAQSRQREALPELERAAGSPGLTGAECTSARAWAGYARLAVADLDGASASAAEALSATPADPLATSVAMATRALACVHRRQLTGALEIIDEAARLADQSPGRQGHRFPIHITRGFILTELDRLDEARSTLETGRRIGEELGTGWHMPSYQMSSAATRFLAGDWDDAITEVEAAQELAHETGESPSLILGHCVLSLICIHRNDLSRAEEAVRAAMGQAGEPGPRYLGLWPMWAHACLLEAGGRATEAFAVLDECWDRFAQLGLTLESRIFGTDLVRLALATGERNRARSVAAAMTEIAGQQDIPSLTGAALHCRGLAEDDAAILRAAAEVCARGSRPLELAQACEDAGTAFARQGDTGQARTLLEQATGIYDRLGADRDLGRAEAVLRAAGIHRGRRGRRGRPPVGWESLTPTEHTVIGLVAEGLSNPQIGDRLFISRRTVQTHLAHVFAKLDLTSRAQLAALVIQHRGGQSPAGTDRGGA